jgi:hypothetical protein
MPTTSTIGTASRNYSTITAWHAAFANGGWIGQCYNDSEFNETPSIGGTSAANYETLTVAAGQSAFDNSANPLKYDVTKGVGLKTTAAYSQILIVGSYCTIQRMQVLQSGGGNSNSTLQISFTAVSVLISQCLFVNTNTSVSRAARIMGANGAGSQSLLNCVFINYAGDGLSVEYANGTVLANCTIVSPSDKANGSHALNISSQSPKITNCAGFGFSGGFSSGGTPTGSNNATDAASISFGSANQTSLTYANQFNGVTSAAMDFTIKSTSALKDNGATDTTDISPGVDIFNTSRPQGSAWDIGAHEYIAAGGGTNVNLVGQSASAVQGSLSLSANKILTGQAATTGQGSLTPQVSLALTGQGTVAGQGSLALTVNKLLTGQAATAGQGALTIVGGGVGISLTGQSMTAGQGSLTPQVNLSLAGQAMVSGQGSLATTAALALLGQQMTAGQGVLNYKVTLLLIGQAATSQQGMVYIGALPTIISIPGQQAYALQGALTLKVTGAIVGMSATVQQGVLSFRVTPNQILDYDCGYMLVPYEDTHMYAFAENLVMTIPAEQNVLYVLSGDSKAQINCGC